MLSQLLFGTGERGLLDDFERLAREMDLALGGSVLPSIRGAAAGRFPPINVGATPSQVHVWVYAPGMAAGDFELTLQQNVLTVAGRRAEPAGSDGTWYLRERAVGDFRRVLTLPEDVDPEHVEARYTDGILRVCLRRRESSRSRRIEIA